MVEDFDCSLLSDILESDNTVGDTGGAHDAHPADLRGVVCVSTTARLGVDTLDVDDTEGVARHDTTLVKREAVLSLSLSLVHEALVDVVSTVNQAVCVVFDLLLLLASQTLEVSDVQVSLLFSFLGTSLPDVRSKHLAAGGEDDMSASVMCLKLVATHSIYGTLHVFANDILSDLLINFVEDALTDL